MTPPDAEKVCEWLIARFKASPSMELLSAESIHLLGEKSSQYFYKDGQLASGELARWLITEFNVPEKDVFEMLKTLKEEGASLGIKVLLPGEASVSEPASSTKPASPSPGQPSGPRPRDLCSDLAGFLHDRRYLEWAILEHARASTPSEVPS